jgi:hypothetical protein
MWLDADWDGRRTSARDYARKVIGDAGTDWRKAVRSLAGYDEAVSAQVAGLLRAAGTAPTDADVRSAAKLAGPQVLRGFDSYAEAWRESQLARQDSRP